jgi:hypothetical protein
LVCPNGGQGFPVGQRYHAAGQAEGDVLTVVNLDSKKAADRFVAEVLMSHGPEPGGFSGEFE